MPRAVAKADMVLKVARMMVDVRIDLAASSLNWLMTASVVLLPAACDKPIELWEMFMLADQAPPLSWGPGPAPPPKEVSRVDMVCS